MKKLTIFCILLVLCITLIGCDNKSNEKNNEQHDSESTMKDVNLELYNTSLYLTGLWNDYITNIRDYAETGKSSIGQELDINFLIENFKLDFKKIDGYETFMNELNDDYSNLKTSFNMALEQLKIIYNESVSTIPIANKVLSYKSNIELFNQYFMSFYNDVIDLYFNE